MSDTATAGPEARAPAASPTPTVRFCLIRPGIVQGVDLPGVDLPLVIPKHVVAAVRDCPESRRAMEAPIDGLLGLHDRLKAAERLDLFTVAPVVDLRLEEPEPDTALMLMVGEDEHGTPHGVHVAVVAELRIRRLVWCPLSGVHGFVDGADQTRAERRWDGHPERLAVALPRDAADAPELGAGLDWLQTPDVGPVVRDGPWFRNVLLGARVPVPRSGRSRDDGEAGSQFRRMYANLPTLADPKGARVVVVGDALDASAEHRRMAENDARGAPTPEEAEERARQAFALGLPGELSERKLLRRWAGDARTRNRIPKRAKAILAIDPSKGAAPDSDLDREDRMRIVREVVAAVRERFAGDAPALAALDHLTSDDGLTVEAAAVSRGVSRSKVDFALNGKPSRGVPGRVREALDRDLRQVF